MLRNTTGSCILFWDWRGLLVQTGLDYAYCMLNLQMSQFCATLTSLLGEACKVPYGSFGETSSGASSSIGLLSVKELVTGPSLGEGTSGVVRLAMLNRSGCKLALKQTRNQQQYQDLAIRGREACICRQVR